MAAPKGNGFWKLRSSHGRKPKFKNAEQLWQACCEYFEAIEKHPLQAAELVKWHGNARIKRVPKMRAMTLTGLCIFLDIDLTTWANYKERSKGFLSVCTQAEAIIKTQKFEGAAADMLNASIIARELGLAEKQQFVDDEGEPAKFIFEVVHPDPSRKPS